MAIKSRQNKQPQFFAFDHRALAASRILTGLLLLFEGLYSLDLFSVKAWLTDQGVWPRIAVLDYTDQRQLQPLMIMGGYHWAYVFHALFIIAAMCITIDYGTRKACGYCGVYWFAVTARCQLIGHGFDRQLGILLYFAVLGDLFSTKVSSASVASVRRNPRKRSFATFAMSVITIMMYFLTAFHKKHESWLNGDAVFLALQTRYISRPFFANVVTNHEIGRKLLVVATLMTRPIEVLLPPLAIILPMKCQRLKGLAVLALIGFHLGLACALRLNDIPFINIGVLLLFLPSGFFDILPGYRCRDQAKLRPSGKLDLVLKDQRKEKNVQNQKDVENQKDIQNQKDVENQKDFQNLKVVIQKDVLNQKDVEIQHLQRLLEQHNERTETVVDLVNAKDAESHIAQIHESQCTGCRLHAALNKFIAIVLKASALAGQVFIFVCSSWNFVEIIWCNGGDCENKWLQMPNGLRSLMLSVGLFTDFKVFSPRPPTQDWWMSFPAIMERYTGTDGKTTIEYVDIFPFLAGKKPTSLARMNGDGIWSTVKAKALFHDMMHTSDDASYEPLNNTEVMKLLFPKKHISYTMRSHRWMKYFESGIVPGWNVNHEGWQAEKAKRERIRSWLANFLCREFNHEVIHENYWSQWLWNSNGGGDAVDRVRLVRFQMMLFLVDNKDVVPRGGTIPDATVEKVIMWDQTC